MVCTASSAAPHGKGLEWWLHHPHSWPAIGHKGMSCTFRERGHPPLPSQQTSLVLYLERIRHTQRPLADSTSGTHNVPSAFSLMFLSFMSMETYYHELCGNKHLVRWEYTAGYCRRGNRKGGSRRNVKRWGSLRRGIWGGCYSGFKGIQPWIAKGFIYISLEKRWHHPSEWCLKKREARKEGRIVLPRKRKVHVQQRFSR